MKNPIICFAIFLVTLSAKAQINAYAAVTAISGTTLSLTNLNQTYHSFNAGDPIIIMQMQDNVIGSNTTNTSSFGTISTIANAGYYEVATISSVAGLPTSITVTKAVSGIFNFSANGSVQIISFRKYGSPDYTTTAAITALPWNGKIGGVVAMQVPGTLTLAYPISADGLGFRGGSASANYEVNCETTVYASNSTNYANKGEGIQVNATGLTTGRAGIGNGGGGGSDDNGGGGGGGNYSTGGMGGFGWTCSATPVGGLGGQPLSSYISKSRIFMGGGGGGGQENNSVGSVGASGGGIILISANNLSTSCSGTVKISTNGNNSANSGNDGAGGAGAGGSIIMSVKTFNVPSSCPLTVQGNGGIGGNVNDPGAHGGGGGGAQGVVIYPNTVPTTNISTVTSNGTGGANSSSAGAPAAGSGSGTSNTGVMGNSGLMILPVKVTRFAAEFSGVEVLVSWSTAMEANNDHFTVERSTDGVNFTAIGVIKGAGNSNTEKDYSFVDGSPLAGNDLYRLQQTDIDGHSVYSQTILVNVDHINKGMTVFPNPATDQFTVQFAAVEGQSYQLSLIDLSGKTVLTMNTLPVNGQIHVVFTSRLVPGIYLVKVGNQAGQQFSKIMIR